LFCRFGKILLKIVCFQICISLQIITRAIEQRSFETIDRIMTPRYYPSAVYDLRGGGLSVTPASHARSSSGMSDPVVDPKAMANAASGLFQDLKSSFAAITASAPSSSSSSSPSASSSSASASDDSRNWPVVLVYLIGGMTFAEVAALRFWAKRARVRLLMATSQMINGNSFVEQLVTHVQTQCEV
jgi:hypothetical protein